MNKGGDNMWKYTHTDELYHYGVLGMKWGKRKAKPNYITISQANRNAKVASVNARKESFAKDKKELSGIGSGRKALNNAKRAADQARKESIANDKAYNKQLRREFKEQKRQAEYAKKVKDNDGRVQMFGKTAVRVSNAIRIGAALAAMRTVNGVIANIGKQSMKNIANNPSMSNGKLHAASLLTAAGIGAVTIASLRNVKRGIDDIKLTNQYDLRQYAKKQEKQNR